MPKLNSLFRFVLMAFLLPSLAARSQEFHENTKFKHLSTDHGLSNNVVSAILQDKQGFMWFGTGDGLNRYDGYKFTVYRHQPNDTNSIGPGNIRCLYEDSEGAIWVGSESALSRFDKKTGKFKVFLNDPGNPHTLSNNIVLHVNEDKDGTIWVSTYGGGLNKFDKKSGKFFAYKNSPSDPGSLRCDYVIKTRIDSNGKLWIGTFGKDGGLSSFDKRSGKFKNYKNNVSGKNPGISNLIYDIAEDKQGLLWIANGAMTNGLNSFDKQNETIDYQYVSKPGDKNSISNGIVLCINDDGYGNLWAGTANGLNILNKKTGRFTVFKNDPVNPNSLSTNYIHTIFRDTQGLVWIGTNGGGIDIYDPDNNKFLVFKNNPKDEKSLPDNEIANISGDLQNRIWVATGAGGITRFDESTGQFHFLKNEINVGGKKRQLGPVSSITKADSNYLWLGMPSFQLVRYDLRTNEYQYPLPPVSGKAESPGFIMDVLVDSKKNLWASTPEGLFRFISDNKNINYTAEVKGTRGLSEKFIGDVFEDSHNNIWISTYNNGLNIYERTTDRIYSLKNDPGNPNSLNNNSVNVTYEAPNGVLWFGTTGGGLNALVLQSGQNKFTDDYKFYHFTEEDGLPNNVVSAIVPDAEGNLWVSTNQGLCRFTPPAYLGLSVKKYLNKVLSDIEKNNVEKDIAVFKNYYLNDGLPANSFTGAAYRHKDNRLYFGTSEGLLSFDPASIKDNPHKPPVYITSFKVFEKEFPLDTPISAKREIILSYKQSFFSFEFVALDYAEPAKNKYAFKMEGFDDKWIEIGNRTYASYTNLDPGEYTFRVKASNNRGVWNEEGTYVRIIITPPFWRTTLFYAICVGIILVLAYGYIKWRERKLVHEKAILEDQVTKRTKEVVEEKEKVVSANAEIIEKNKKLEGAYHIIEEKNLQITDSINYALYIQKAILPPVSKIDEILNDYFILFKPKDIVSGDFYWLDSKLATPRANQPAQQIVTIAAVDCTGHGVPGALMSVIGSTLLNQTINRATVHNSGDALGFFNKKVSETLHSIKDGMDMSLCFINTEKLELQYAGANNPIYIIREINVGELRIENSRKEESPKIKNNILLSQNEYGTASSYQLIEIKADKQAIGADTQETKVFTNNMIRLEKGDAIYMFTDGYADQFGGPKGKKFKYGKFKELLLEIQSETMQRQQEILNDRFEEWRGNLEQVDDILIIGIKV